jgi:saposin
MFTAFFTFSLSVRLPRRPTTFKPFLSTSSREICLNLATHFESEIFKNPNSLSLFSDANAFCQSLDPSVSRVCEQFVASDFVSLKHAILKGADPETACTSVLKKLRGRKNPERVICEACQSVLSFVQSLSESGATKREIEERISDLRGVSGIVVKSVVLPGVEEVLIGFGQGRSVFEMCDRFGLCDEECAVLAKPRRVVAVVRPGDIICDICVSFVEELADLLNSSVEVDIEQFITDYCNQYDFPVSTYCKIELDQTVEAIINLIEALVDPTSICQSLGFCTSAVMTGAAKARAAGARRARVTRARQTQAAGNVPGRSCQDFVVKIKEAVSQEAEPDIEQLVDGVCGSANSPCRQALDTNIEMIVNFIELDMEAERICTLIGAGQNRPRKARRFSRHSTAALLCAISQDYILFVKQLLLEGETEDGISPLVSALSNTVPKSVGSVVGPFIKRNLPTILGLISDGVDNFEIAVRFGLCRPMDRRVSTQLSLRRPCVRRFPKDVICEASKAARGRGSVRGACDQLPFPVSALCTDVLSATSVCDDSVIKTSHTRRYPIRRRIGSATSCNDAQDVLSYIALLANEGLSDETLTQKFDAMCSLLPYPHGTICTRFIGENLPEVIASFQAGKTAFDVAVEIGLCGRQASRRTSRAILIWPKQTVPGDIFCDICQDAIEWLEKLILEEFVEVDLEALVAELCDVLPWPISTWCQSFLDENIEAIIADIEAGIGSLNICGKLGLCSASPAQRKPSVRKNDKVLRKIPGDIFCDICQELVDYIAQLIVNGTIGPAIKEAVEQLCDDLLPWPLSSWCASFIDQYVDEIIADIEAGIDNICNLIGFCENPSPSDYRKALQTRAKRHPRRPRAIAKKRN